MGSILKYIGKKELDLSYELDTFKFSRYCEPFSGSFGTGHKLIESGFTGKSVINDLDKNIYEFWVAIKNNPTLTYFRVNELFDKIDSAKNMDEKHRQIYIFASSNELESRAAAEYVTRFYSRLSGIEISHKTDRTKHNDFMNQSLVARQCNIHNWDYKRVMQKYDSEDTFYLIDPPYAIDRVDNYYRCESRWFYHAGLRDDIKNLKGRWILTYNNCEYIHELYKEYNQYIVSRPMFRGEYTELYITNYDKSVDTIKNFLCTADDFEYYTLMDKNTDALFREMIDNLGSHYIDTSEANDNFDITGF